MTSADYLAKVPYCPMPAPSTDVELTRREDGTMVLKSRIKLGETSGTICSFLPHWAAISPNRSFRIHSGRRHHLRSVRRSDRLRAVSISRMTSMKARRLAGTFRRPG